MAGEREEAIRILDDFRAKSSGSYISPANFAKVYVGLGEYDEAFKQLEKAAAERGVKLPWFLVDPCLTPIRSDPRFADLLTRTGLPQIAMSVNV